MIEATIAAALAEGPDGRPVLTLDTPQVIDLLLAWWRSVAEVQAGLGEAHGAASAAVAEASTPDPLRPALAALRARLSDLDEAARAAGRPIPQMIEALRAWQRAAQAVTAASADLAGAAAMQARCSADPGERARLGEMAAEIGAQLAGMSPAALAAVRFPEALVN